MRYWPNYFEVELHLNKVWQYFNLQDSFNREIPKRAIIKKSVCYYFPHLFVFDAVTHMTGCLEIKGITCDYIFDIHNYILNVTNTLMPTSNRMKSPPLEVSLT